MAMTDAEHEAPGEQLDARAPEALLPLTPGALHILLALAGGERHGYAIMQETARLSDGAVRLGPGTLYGAITRLEEYDWIRPLDSDERRRPYRLTPAGRRQLQEQIAGLSQIVKTAQGRLRHV